MSRLFDGFGAGRAPGMPAVKGGIQHGVDDHLGNGGNYGRCFRETRRQKIQGVR